MLGKEADQAASPKCPFMQDLLPQTLSLRPLGRSNHPFSLRSEGLLLLTVLGLLLSTCDAFPHAGAPSSLPWTLCRECYLPHPGHRRSLRVRERR